MKQPLIALMVAVALGAVVPAPAAEAKTEVKAENGGSMSIGGKSGGRHGPKGLPGRTGKRAPSPVAADPTAKARRKPKSLPGKSGGRHGALGKPGRSAGKSGGRGGVKDEGTLEKSGQRGG